MLQQMSLGTLTEKGIVMIKAPVLSQEIDSGSLFSFLRGQKSQHPKIVELAGSLKRLKEIDELKGMKAVKTKNEKEIILNNI